MLAKHSEARDLFLSLTGDEDAVILSVCDNGKGFHFGKAIVQAAARHSFGIENLHNIADEIGGATFNCMSWHSRDGNGSDLAHPAQGGR